MTRVTPIPAFDDNYIWLITGDGDAAAVVDPGDEEPVLAALEAAGLELTAILITHHHMDHVGGVAELKAAFPCAEVIGPDDRRIRGVTRVVGDGDEIRVPGLGLRLEVLAVPGHTATHVAYLGEGILFCGDTLFAGGCGRVFDGTFGQLSDSLARIAALPPETLIYCAHEYTLANLGFARWVEPASAALDVREARERGLRARGLPTVPSRLADELATNPFLRVEVPAVRAAAERAAGRPLSTRAEVFTALRRWKDERYD